MVGLYYKVMGHRGDVNLDDPEAKFICRVWDGMDGCWCDCTGAVGAREALECWIDRTDNGTRATKFSDIDYYCIFPADTRMMWSGDREMFR